jgi:hypothetical protein
MSDQTDLDELIQQMAAMGIGPEVLGMATHQLGRGEQLADTPSATGMHVGGTYQAASPLEHLAVAVRRGVGAHQMGQAQQAYQDQLGVNQQGLAAGAKAQSDFQQQGINGLLNALQARRAQVQAPAGAPGMAAPVGTGEAGTDGWGY